MFIVILAYMLLDWFIYFKIFIELSLNIDNVSTISNFIIYVRLR